MGRANAAVLPEPVSAMPIISRPSKANGMASTWIGRGLANPIRSQASQSSLITPKSRNDLVAVDDSSLGAAIVGFSGLASGLAGAGEGGGISTSEGPSFNRRFFEECDMSRSKFVRVVRLGKFIKFIKKVCTNSPDLT
jgi:hypothetical protein